MNQLSEEEGEVNLINCDYSTNRFPFTYSWWSAYGYQVRRYFKYNNLLFI